MEGMQEGMREALFIRESHLLKPVTQQTRLYWGRFTCHGVAAVICLSSGPGLGIGLRCSYLLHWGIPESSVVKIKKKKKNSPAVQELQETRVPSLGPEDLLEEEVATYPSILPWRIPLDGGAWWATVHRLRKSWTRLKWLSVHTHTHMGWMCPLPISYVKVLTPSTSKCDLIWKQGHCRCN